jgi:hypothetical protein
MSMRELKQAIDKLSGLLEEFLEQHRLLQTNEMLDAVARGEDKAKRDEYIDTDLFSVSTYVAPVVNTKSPAGSKSCVVKKAGKSEQGSKTAGPKSSGYQSGKRLFRRKLKKMKNTIREIENGVRMNLTTIEQHLEKMKAVQDDIASCKAAADTL